MSSEDADREAILRRRAVFLSAALSTFGCSPAGPPVEPTGVASAPPPQSSLQSATATAETPPPAPVRPSFAEYVKAEAPPFTVSATLTPDEQRQLEGQAQKWAPVYEKLERVWNDVPLCSLSSVECRPAWERTLRGLGDLEAYDVEPKCGYSQTLSAGYVGREDAHRRFLRRTIESMRAELATRAVDDGAETVFDQIFRPRAYAGACLSCMISIRVDERIIFDATSTAISPLAEQQLEAVAARLKSSKHLNVEVRGHADSTEADASGLAMKRASVIAKWLVDHGVAASRVKARGLGTELPLGSSVKAEGRVANRRVDFEVR